MNEMSLLEILVHRIYLHCNDGTDHPMVFVRANMDMDQRPLGPPRKPSISLHVLCIWPSTAIPCSSLARSFVAGGESRAAVRFVS